MNTTHVLEYVLPFVLVFGFWWFLMHRMDRGSSVYQYDIAQLNLDELNAKAADGWSVVEVLESTYGEAYNGIPVYLLVNRKEKK